MPRSKWYKNLNELKKEAKYEKIKTAYWACKAFNFSDIDTIKYINSGILGTKKDGGPVTISHDTYYKHKKQFREPPTIFEDLKKRSTEGYLELLTSIQNVIDILVEMSGKNLFAKGTTPNQKQVIIDSIITKVLPAKASAANAIKRMMDSNMISGPQETKQLVARTE